MMKQFNLNVLHPFADKAPIISKSAYITPTCSIIGDAVILHGCTIDDECLIGMGSIVMDKVIVQKHVMVAAGSLVPEGKVLESGYLYLGNPVRKLRSLTDEEIGHFMYSANHYIQLKNQYMAQ